MRSTNGRNRTPLYILFFILFSTDTWRIGFGFAAAILLTPHVAPPDLSIAGRTMVYVMVAAVGWSLSSKPARWIAAGLKRTFAGGFRR